MIPVYVSDSWKLLLNWRMELNEKGPGDFLGRGNTCYLGVGDRMHNLNVSAFY